MKILPRGVKWTENERKSPEKDFLEEGFLIFPKSSMKHFGAFSSDKLHY